MRGLDEELPEPGAVGVGRRDVSGLGPVVEGVPAVPGAIDELVADDERAELEVGAQRARRARPDDPPDADLAEGPEVGAVGDPVRRQLVLRAVPRQECDLLAAELAEGDGRGRLPVRRVELDGLDALQERVEPAPAEDPDLSRGRPPLL